MELYLTRNGLLYSDGCHNARHAFYTNTGEFLRQCCNDEFNYLVNEIGVPKIKFEPIGGSQACQIYNFATEKLAMLLGQGDFPIWNKITSMLVEADYSSYKEGTCNNGGDYGFFIYHHWFVAIMPNGKIVFRYVTTYDTTAEFEYDELNGGFQTDLGQLVALNTKKKFNINTVTHRDNDGYIVEEFCMLEQFSEIGNYDMLMSETITTIPSAADVEKGVVKTEKLAAYPIELYINENLRELGIEPNNLVKKQR